MKINNLNNKKYRIRLLFANIVRYLRILKLNIIGYDINKNVIIENNVKLDKLYKSGIHIGENTLIASGTVILTHDHCKRDNNNQPFITDTWIGKNCFIAINSIILPGVIIGDEVIVGAGSVVTKNVPSNCIVAGNPAKVIRTEISMNKFATLNNWSINNGWIKKN